MLNTSIYRKYNVLTLFIDCSIYGMVIIDNGTVRYGTVCEEDHI